MVADFGVCAKSYRRYAHQKTVAFSIAYLNHISPVLLSLVCVLSHTATVASGAGAAHPLAVAAAQHPLRGGVTEAGSGAPHRAAAFAQQGPRSKSPGRPSASGPALGCIAQVSLHAALAESVHV
jgi:hypothetical protein